MKEGGVLFEGADARRARISGDPADRVAGCSFKQHVLNR
jgi:hypothetical protein